MSDVDEKDITLCMAEKSAIRTWMAGVRLAHNISGKRPDGGDGRLIGALGNKLGHDVKRQEGWVVGRV